MTITLHSYRVELWNPWGYKHPQIGAWLHEKTVYVTAPDMDTAFEYALAEVEPDPRKRGWWTERSIHRLTNT